MSRVHVLKTWPAPFEAMRAGRKTFEYRLNDRDFQIGDRLVLQEYNPETDDLTGEALTRLVVYVLSGGKFGVPPKHCVMSVEPEEAARRPGVARPSGFIRCAEGTTGCEVHMAAPGSGEAACPTYEQIRDWLRAYAEDAVTFNQYEAEALVGAAAVLDGAMPSSRSKAGEP